jgi:hypothetical protein
VHEADTWLQDALDLVDSGLKRLITAANDLHRQDDSKSAEQYYAEELTKLIKAQEMKFDPKDLE